MAATFDDLQQESGFGAREIAALAHGFQVSLRRRAGYHVGVMGFPLAEPSSATSGALGP